MVPPIMDDGTASDASSSSPHRYPDWMLLDRRVRVDGGYPDEDHFHATTACAMSSGGETVRVSICAAPPPVASRLFVSWTGSKHLSSEEDDQEEYDQDRRPSFLFMAAHGGSILLRLSHDHRGSDLFVYTARSTGPPLLRPLPGLDRRYDTYSLYKSDGLYDMFTRDSVGLLRDGDGGEFVVAELRIDRDNQYLEGTPVKAGICVYRSGSPDNKWKATWLHIRHKKRQTKELYLFRWWYTHEVVAFGDSLCYVDYFQGVLFVDVLSGHPELHYVRLPVKNSICDLENYNYHTKFSDRSRSLCVTDGGRTMKFVEVVTATASGLFTIKVWRLRQEGRSMTWETESDMEDANLWAQPGYGDLPRVAPTFPRVSLEEPYLIYFVLSNKRQVDHEDETWVILVDMLNKTLRSSFRCTNDSGSLATDRASIPCEFSKYLHVLKSS